MKTKRKTVSLLAILLLAAVPGLAQQQPPEPAKIHGHAQDPTTAPIKGANVALSTDGAVKDIKYKFPTDPNGDYKGDGIAPGTYFLTLITSDGKTVDQFQNVKFAAGQDVAQDFDLSRADYIAKLTPEQRKQIEEVRKQNSEINKQNNQIKNLNENLKQAREANHAHDYAKAESLMQAAVQAKPDAPVLWIELGAAQNGLKKYDDAITSFKKAAELEAASKKPSNDVLGAANSGLGEAYAYKGSASDATAAFDAAAKANPANAAIYYTNEAIIFRNKNPDAVVAAADKAIAASPDKPVPYFLKGEALVPKATMDPKTNKIVLPPGCAEAYQKYLELAPDGQFANDAKALLTSAGETVQTSVSNRKGRK
jgi:tetratricopeptide (TPR) repeat protein